MKIKFLIFFTFIYINNGFSQFSEQLIITTEALGARGVFAADLDGDGDLDVLSAAESGNTIAWHENLNGLGDFGSQNIIIETLDAAVDVIAADLDGDEDMDVIVASKGFGPTESKVSWFENLDGLGSFSDEHLISGLIQGAVSVFTADLDGDNDLDVLSASFTDNTVAWYANDGLGNFGPLQLITNTALSTRDAIAVDVDGDLDMDVISVSTAADKIIWFENLDGFGNFSPEKIINSNTNGPLSVYASDFDGDNDLDVVSSSPADNEIFWYENIDGQGNFGSEQLINQNLISPYDVYAADLDNDNDMDMLAVSANDDKIVWHENLDGAGSFGQEQIITIEVDFPRSIYVADIDDDGDLDVLSASSVDSKIAWYRNLTPLNIEENYLQNIILYPSPVKNLLNINNKSAYKIKSLKVFDMLGRLIIKKKEDVNKIDASQLNKGLFLVKIKTEKGILIKKFIKE